MKTAILSIEHSDSSFKFKKEIKLYNAYDSASIETATIKDLKSAIVDGLIGNITNEKLWDIIEECNSSLCNEKSPFSEALHNIGLDLEYGVGEYCDQHYFIYEGEVVISIYLNSIR